MSLIISVNPFSKASGNCRAWVPISPGLRLQEGSWVPAERFHHLQVRCGEASPGTQQSVPVPVWGHNSSPSGQVVASLPVPCPRRRQRLDGRFGGCKRRGLPPNLLTKAPQGATASAVGLSVRPCSQAISCSDLRFSDPEEESLGPTQ